MSAGVEFVKHYRAHLNGLIATDVAWDGMLLATAGGDRALKVFDIVNFGTFIVIFRF